MGKLKLCVLHCTATPPSVQVTPEKIRQWHQGPLDLFDQNHNLTGVLYKGKTYPNRRELPKEEIGGVSIDLLKGRGWRQVGYSILIDNHAKRHELVKVDDDQWIDSWEITNGVAGINSISMHVVTAGGVDADGHAEDNRTPEQVEKLKEVMFEILEKHPQIQFAGHNQFSPKACPSYNVPRFCREIGVPERNIHQK